jgi:RNA 2',3'-cyclic 3'-phosphodiesterase
MFIGVWPSDEVRAAIAALPRPDGVRWTTRDQWHATLQFLGDVADDDVAAWTRKVGQVAASLRTRTVTLGPATRVLGRRVLMIPVAGLDDVATAFTDEPFTGHVTLARADRMPRALAGIPIAASWEVTEIALIRSHLGGGPARYETIATGTFAQ